MKIVGLSKIEKLKLIGQCIKAATAIIGSSLILTEGHPYLSVAILALGGISNEIVSFIKERENKQLLDEATESVNSKQSNEEVN
jgi:hypothetical protein